jgi:hypothetical protein
MIGQVSTSTDLLFNRPTSLAQCGMHGVCKDTLGHEEIWRRRALVESIFYGSLNTYVIA